MTKTRRNFLQAGSLALGGALFSTPANPLHAAAAASLEPELTEDDWKVIGFLRNFSNRIVLHGGCVAAKIRGKHDTTRLLAETTNLEHFGSCLLDEADQHLGTCHIAGNTLSFKLGDSEYSIENLVPASFADRIRQLQLSASGDIRCPHEALQFNPDSQELSDPFGVLSAKNVTRTVREPYYRIITRVRRSRNGQRRVRHIKRLAYRRLRETTQVVKASLRLFPADQSPADAFTTLIGALVDKVQFGLTPDKSFVSAKRRILNARVALDAEQSEQICREFIGAVSSLSGDTATIKELLKSRLLRGCLAQTLGINAADIVKNFNRLRAESDPSYTDGAIWLSLLLYDEISQGRAFPWIDQADKLRLTKANADRKQAETAYLE